MDVIYSSSDFWILAYPAQRSFELFDKKRLCALFLEGGDALHFRLEMENIPGSLRNEASVDALLKDYCSSARPIVFH
jgi:hypothetical protein